MVYFIEICNLCARKAIIEAAKRIINSDKVGHGYSDLNFGVTFLEHSVYLSAVSTTMHAVWTSRCKTKYVTTVRLWRCDELMMMMMMMMM